MDFRCVFFGRLRIRVRLSKAVVMSRSNMLASLCGSTLMQHPITFFHLKRCIIQWASEVLDDFGLGRNKQKIPKGQLQ